ncbi:hypothetical protein [Paenibacillus sp. ISL-20]|uniref:hypothetical protein n=1 Tax=Paenibacillus sp. ISL-20 TaxID=2819163 RepID=UPI001BEC7CCE|nr:hypothetical protein [Paenibacillus sp. ISL-20]MBT2764812.1 hypothetical protein [Paenibacillus sp. ISL-20]
MPIRDSSLEGELFNIDESGVLNGFYMLSLLHYLKSCTLDELATAMYLFRFVNITEQLLGDNDQIEYLSGIPEWERYNLDTMLSNVLIEKYTDRFKTGLKELISRGMILNEGQDILLLDSVRENSRDILEDKKFNLVVHKAKYVSKLIETFSIEELNEKIKTLIGGT